MTETLFVNACVREEESRTLELCRAYLQSKESFSEVYLPKMQLQPLTAEMVEERSALQEAEKWDNPIFEFAHQFAQADEIVIGAPYWDLSFPALLKIYIEHISVCGVTFQMDDAMLSYDGLCKAKSLTYISTCGGIIAEGFDLGYEYLCGIAKMFGIDEVRYVVAEGLDIQGADVESLMGQAQKELAAL